MRCDGQLAITEFTENILARVRYMLEARQSKKAACAFYCVNQPEDTAQKGRIIRILLKFDELNVNRCNILSGFRKEFTQQVVHRILGAGPSYKGYYKGTS